MSLFPELDVIQDVTTNMASSGKLFENTVVEHLREKYPNHDIKEQVKAGYRPKVNKKIVVDILFNHDIIVSAKFQDVAGTAEEKIIQEKGTLQYLCHSGRFKKAYIVYDGIGFSMIDYYQCEEMKRYYRDPYPDVTLISFDEFKELNIV